MELAPDWIGVFSPLDAFGALLLVCVWTGLTYLIERPPFGWRSTHQAAESHRRAWMAQVALREMRMMDGGLLASLRNGCAFFSSACMLAIGGLVALLGQTEQLVLVARDLAGGPTDVRVVWEVKLLFVLFMLANGLLKFVWSHRVFGYAAILLGAIPAPGKPDVDSCAARAAVVLNTAARAYNRGLRTLYFAIAALTWLLGPLALICATCLTAAMLLRREFRSESRRALLD